MTTDAAAAEEGTYAQFRTELLRYGIGEEEATPLEPLKVRTELPPSVFTCISHRLYAKKVPELHPPVR